LPWAGHRLRPTAEDVDGGMETRISRASVGRLSLYLRRLEELRDEGTTRVSSSMLAHPLGINDAQVRKDLAALGTYGQPGIGYEGPELIIAIRHRLGLDRPWDTALVGVGNLARALLRYQGFLEHGFRLVALFDSDPAKIGQELDGRRIQPMSALPEAIPRLKIELAVITVPANAAQSVAEKLIAAGVRGLLNFTPGVLRVPEPVSVVNVDLTVQLEQLAFLVQMGRGG
jgi:redox-sensing transcriptional repressor